MNHGQLLGQERKFEPLRRKQTFLGGKDRPFTWCFLASGPTVRTGHPGAVELAVEAQHGLGQGHC